MFVPVEVVDVPHDGVRLGAEVLHDDFLHTAVGSGFGPNREDRLRALDERLPDADQQLRIEMVGTVGVDAETYDIAYTFLISATDNVLSQIGAYELGDVGSGLREGVDGWAELQASRLADLLG